MEDASPPLDGVAVPEDAPDAAPPPEEDDAMVMPLDGGASDEAPAPELLEVEPAGPPSEETPPLPDATLPDEEETRWPPSVAGPPPVAGGLPHASSPAIPPIHTYRAVAIMPAR